MLKPNLAFANPPDWATGTHPDTLVAVAQACLEAGAKEVLVLEYPLHAAQKCLERTGAAEALKALPGVKVRMLEDDEEFRQVKIPRGTSLKSAEIAKKALDADVLINLPQAKQHGSAGVSFGLKNAMGLILNRKQFHLQLDLHQAIADLNLAVRPHLTLLDATHVLLANGPKGPGPKAALGKMFAGRAIASVDACALSVVPFENKQTTLAEAKHITLAARHGLGGCDVTKMKVQHVST